jgi:hypothetical protein
VIGFQSSIFLHTIFQPKRSDNLAKECTIILAEQNSLLDRNGQDRQE